MSAFIGKRMSAFDLLNTRIQKALKKLGIDRPSEAQEGVIPELMERQDTLLVAPTGIGKTEAAMLPILNDILEKEPEGFYVVYVTPLRALNRDMLKRLEWFGNELGITVGVRDGVSVANGGSSVSVTVSGKVSVTTSARFSLGLGVEIPSLD